MKQWLRTHGVWWLAWLVLTLAAAAWLVRSELTRLHEDFDTQARIAHRLMSQQVVQYDAVLATLALLDVGSDSTHPEQRLSGVYPSILGVARRDADQRWPEPALAEAEARSRAAHRGALAAVDLPAGRYRLVMGADPVSYALSIDLAASVPWQDWPMDPRRSPVRVALERGGQHYLVQPGQDNGGPWRFAVRKTLASASQDFDLVASRGVGIADLPWARMAAATLALAALLWGLRLLQRQRTARLRAEELLRLGQVARLNTLGELAAGMAHELNQPLTAVVANTQAARRLLDDEEPDLDTARSAMGQAVAQARRASEVVGRLRRAIERPGGGIQAVVLQEAVAATLHLLEPDCARRGVAVQFDAGAPVRVRADPVALEQIVHNLLLNALQALDAVPAGERRIVLQATASGRLGLLQVCDSGPGIAPELLPRLFEPFVSTRPGGLGLGLSLCETLAGEMNGTLRVRTDARGDARGACFELELPLAP
ncbi:MAG: sensor histidine kinase [Comamonas sp.]